MTTPRRLKPTPHLQRVQKWRNLASVQGKCMIDLVLAHLAPAIEALGFTRIDASSMGPDHQPSGSEVCFERMVGDALDCITVNFENMVRQGFKFMVFEGLTNHLIRWCVQRT